MLWYDLLFSYDGLTVPIMSKVLHLEGLKCVVLVNSKDENLVSPLFLRVKLYLGEIYGEVIVNIPHEHMVLRCSNINDLTLERFLVNLDFVLPHLE
jgi:hypothetical protein